ncbi:MAG: DinB family protein, partial [Pyrinomonadaceae bacterium]
VEQFVERAKTEKYTSPEVVRPGGGVSVADSLARMRQTRAALSELRPRLERADLSAARYPHPAFGPLDLYQWLAFIGLHEARHLGQIEALTNSPSYPAGNN